MSRKPKVRVYFFCTTCKERHAFVLCDTSTLDVTCYKATFRNCVAVISINHNTDMLP